MNGWENFLVLCWFFSSTWLWWNFLAIYNHWTRIVDCAGGLDWWTDTKNAPFFFLNFFYIINLLCPAFNNCRDMESSSCIFLYWWTRWTTMNSIQGHIWKSRNWKWNGNWKRKLETEAGKGNEGKKLNNHFFVDSQVVCFVTALVFLAVVMGLGLHGMCSPPFFFVYETFMLSKGYTS